MGGWADGFLDFVSYSEHFFFGLIVANHPCDGYAGENAQGTEPRKGAYALWGASCARRSKRTCFDRRSQNCERFPAGNTNDGVRRPVLRNEAYVGSANSANAGRGDYLEITGATGQGGHGSTASADAYNGYEAMGRGANASAGAYDGSAYESMAIADELGGEPRGRTASFA